MPASPYPNLGFDPCPGDLAGYQALAAYAGRSAATLAEAVRTLGSAGSQDWRGQAADAFRAHVDQDVLPLARQAGDSVGRGYRAADLGHQPGRAAGRGEGPRPPGRPLPVRTGRRAALRRTPGHEHPALSPVGQARPEGQAGRGEHRPGRDPRPRRRHPRPLPGRRPARRQPAGQRREHGPPPTRPLRLPLARRRG
jgi:hypothetical protein